jgi:signal transduction histidine kinase/DNA-binding response OmpR family regulator/sugar lactone lactonase YvrE
MKHRIGFLLFILLAFSCARPSIPVGTDTGYIVDNFGDNVLTGFHFDQNGYVWMMPSTGRYLFKTDGSIYIRYEYDPDVPSSLSANKVNDLTVDGQNRVWVATQKGVDRFDPARGCFDHIPVDDSNNYVIDIDQDGKGRIVIVTRRALLELDEVSGRFVRKFQIPHLTLSEPHLSFDGSGNLWLRLDNSLTCFDENYNQLFKKEYARLAGTPVYDGSKYIWVSDGDKLMTLNIHSFKEAEASDLFPGLAGIRPANLLKVSDGLLVVNSATGPFLVDLSRDTATDLQHAEGKEKTILEYAQAGSRALQTGPNGNLWIADREGGFQHHIFNLGWVPLDRKYLDFLVSGDVQTSAQNRHFTWLVSGGRIAAYDKENGQFTSIQDIRSLTDLIVSMVSADEEGHVLLSGRARAARPLELFTTEPDGSLIFEKRFKLPYAGIGTITRDGSIYAVGTGTVIMRVEKDGTIREIANLFNDYACYATLMKPLSDGSILICFTDHAPVLFHPEDERVEVLETAGLDQVYFSAIEEDALSSVWIGSTDKGLYRYDKADGSFGKVADYPETTVNSIAADENGNVFVIGDYHAVYRFGTATGEDGRPVWADYADFPKERRLYPLPDGTVALVGQGTYEWFNEERVNTPQDVEIFTHIYLTSGKRILYSFPAAAYPSNRVTLHLDRNTEDLNLFIGVMDMTSPYSHHSYFYDINHFRTGPRESFDKPQIPLYGVSRPYNTIRFRVAGNSESSSTEPFTIRVLMNLLPGEIISLVAVLSLLAAAAVFWFLSRKKKEEAEAERIKREMTEKLNMENIDFFANISHEFRTPLTLIHGAASSLETKDDRALGIIRRNTERMMRLVSQMLDFNKLDHGILKLHVKEEPVMDIIRAVKSDFEIGASVKGLQLNLETDVEDKSGYVDRDKLEKILYNLCSNAVKYTPPGGQIDLSVSVTPDDTLKVSVADTGIGIPEDALEAVFDRFYRTKGTGKAGGTGIGLYYTRALVNLHHGSIRADVRKEDDKVIGSVFSFSLPLRKDVYSEAELGGASDAVTSLDANDHLSEYVEDTPETGTDSSKPSVMLIDDDYEIVYYLKNLLADTYNVYFRFDAMSGYKMIEEVQPDIIVCDMMMLEMDGLQLCRMVKENLSMSHIPFVMLTAKSTMQDQIDSLGAGADAYVVKPFEPGYLMALIKSMIDNRNRVRKMLGSSLSVPKSSKEVLSGQDNEFMEKLYDIMKKSLPNGELDIDPVAEKLGVSRSKFYYKVKALTGQTPNEFFTTYKLNYAAEMIKQGKYKISAIADMLGFSSSSHFAALFRKQFGVLPSQYTPGQ